MNKVFLSEEAKSEIRDILQYSFETFGERQSDAYKTQLKRAIDQILIMPTIGHKRIDIPPYALAYNIEKHVIIYEIIEESNIIHILRILHSRMDFQSEF